MLDLTPLSAALYGEDHDTPSEYAMCLVGASHLADSATACAISVGGVAALARKGGTHVPNEDCLFAYDDGVVAVHVIADGHHGHDASHEFVEAVSAAYASLGATAEPRQVFDQARRHWASEAASGDPRYMTMAAGPARTTLSITRLDRARGAIDGLSLGDSPIFIGGLESGVRPLVTAEQSFVAPWDPETFEVSRTREFHATVEPGEWLLSCSDGVTECHYGQPETSIRPEHLETLLIRAGACPDRLVEALAQLALEGVEGSPGGEDNLAIVASIA